MLQKNSCPKWWVLFLLLALLLTGFGVEISASIPENMHRAIEVGLLILFTGGVEFWIYTNRRAILYVEQEKSLREYHQALGMIQAHSLPVQRTSPGGRLFHRLAPGWLVMVFSFLAGILQQ